MHAISKRDSQEFLRVLGNIQDEKVRYFYVMLGEAIGESGAQIQRPLNNAGRANTGPSHLAELEMRLNAQG